MFSRIRVTQMYSGLTVALQETVPIFRISKRLRASRPRSRERSGDVPGGQTTLQIAAAQELMKKACIKAVTGSHRVDDLHHRGRTDKTVRATLRHRPFRAQFHDNYWHHGSQFENSIIDALGPSNFLRLPRVR